MAGISNPLSCVDCRQEKSADQRSLQVAPCAQAGVCTTAFCWLLVEAGCDAGVVGTFFTAAVLADFGAECAAGLDATFAGAC